MTIITATDPAEGTTATVAVHPRALLANAPPSALAAEVARIAPPEAVEAVTAALLAHGTATHDGITYALTGSTAPCRAVS